ncbi:type-F conjugative transfer system protein TraW [Vibrio sp. 10N.247.311.51]|uniref:type-F conjugative transfer system protein TraW n=1 Tax=Vibrio sp. 10N.247.311.51 TaxID=3229996 RepID=UPI00354E6C8B
MKITLILVGLSLCFMAQAKELGRIGPTFPIGEIDMLIWIENRLKGFEASGQLDDMKHEFSERVKQSVETPTPVNLPTTLAPKVFHVDPSLTLPQDLVDPTTGKIFAKAGTTINPFDPKTWPNGAQYPQFEYRTALAFFDAQDAQQLAWAKNLTASKPIKWVLTGGSPNQVAKALDSRIYFDQQGSLTTRLHLKHVPSLVEQSGIHWKVTEFDVSHIQPESQP